MICDEHFNHKITKSWIVNERISRFVRKKLILGELHERYNSDDIKDENYLECYKKLRDHLYKEYTDYIGKNKYNGVKEDREKILNGILGTIIIRNIMSFHHKIISNVQNLYSEFKRNSADNNQVDSKTPMPLSEVRNFLTPIYEACIFSKDLQQIQVKYLNQFYNQLVLQENHYVLPMILDFCIENLFRETEDLNEYIYQNGFLYISRIDLLYNFGVPVTVKRYISSRLDDKKSIIENLPSNLIGVSMGLPDDVENRINSLLPISELPSHINTLVFVLYLLGDKNTNPYVYLNLINNGSSPNRVGSLTT